jgi:hypothetical protein
MHQKAETLSSTGWTALPDLPLQVFNYFSNIFTISGELRATALLDWKMERFCCSADGIGKVKLPRLESGN